MKLNNYDLSFAVIRLPEKLKTLLKTAQWKNKVYVGGGYIRALVSQEKLNDIDLFVQSKEDAKFLADQLALLGGKIYTTDNAYTITGFKLPIQIIHRWVFPTPDAVSQSFDFTICCAVFWYGADNKWDSFTDDGFYMDLAAKRLVYRSPVRNEDAGGSLLRVLKYYQRGYRIPLDSLGAVVARISRAVKYDVATTEEQVASVITGLLRVVDPSVDPLHEAHLPAMKNEIEPEIPESAEI